MSNGKLVGGLWGGVNNPSLEIRKFVIYLVKFKYNMCTPPPLSNDQKNMAYDQAPQKYSLQYLRLLLGPERVKSRLYQKSLNDTF